jgi:hypothetical protein
MLQRNIVEKIKTHILRSGIFFPPKTVPFMRCRKTWWSQRGSRQYGACAWHTGYVRLHALKHTSPHPHTHTNRNVLHLLLFHGNDGFVNATQSYVIRTLPLLFYVLKKCRRSTKIVLNVLLQKTSRLYVKCCSHLRRSSGRHGDAADGRRENQCKEAGESMHGGGTAYKNMAIQNLTKTSVWAAIKGGAD